MNRLRTCVGFVLLLLLTSSLTAAGADLRLVEPEIELARSTISSSA